jgi:hypothetical protein
VVVEIPNIFFCVKTLKKMLGDANCIENNVGVLEVSSRTLKKILIFLGARKDVGGCLM